MSPLELVWRENWKLIGHRNPPAVFPPKFRHLNRGIYKAVSNRLMLILQSLSPLQVCPSPKCWNGPSEVILKVLVANDSFKRYLHRNKFECHTPARQGTVGIYFAMQLVLEILTMPTPISPIFKLISLYCQVLEWPSHICVQVQSIKLVQEV